MSGGMRQKAVHTGYMPKNGMELRSGLGFAVIYGRHVCCLSPLSRSFSC